MRKETKSLRADVMAKEEKLERMEFDMDNVKTKLRLNTLRREREQEQANDRVREREREVRSLLAQGTGKHYVYFQPVDSENKYAISID